MVSAVAFLKFCFRCFAFVFVALAALLATLLTSDFVSLAPCLVLSAVRLPRTFALCSVVFAALSIDVPV